MRITRVVATPLNVPVRIDVLGLDRSTALSVCIVEVETDSGVHGHGFTAITEEEVVAAAINEVAAPALIGVDPLDHERVWELLYWLLAPRGQTGYALHAVAALDVALWDIKGKHLGMPLWRLLGGARSQVPVYATFGFNFFDREQLAAAAKLWVERGFRRLKMTVGHQALARRDEPRPIAAVIAEDARRIRAVRDAVGDEIELYIDANCSLDAYHAEKLCRLIEPYHIAFFEEPITQNDARQMAQLRQRTSIPLACGQNEGLAFRFRDLLLAGSIDVAQPNVVLSGGYSQCLKIAGMAAAFNVPIANGGAWPWHNMHLQAGVSNGTLVEYHYVAALLCEQLFHGLAKPHDSMLELPSIPGLGFELNQDAVRELARQPTSRGKGKG